MPHKYVPPELFLVHNKVKVYRTYAHDQFNDPRHYWFTTDIGEKQDYEFDVRDLPEIGVDENIILRIINAINLGLLKTPPNNRITTRKTSCGV